MLLILFYQFHWVLRFSSYTVSIEEKSEGKTIYFFFFSLNDVAFKNRIFIDEGFSKLILFLFTIRAIQMIPSISSGIAIQSFLVGGSVFSQSVENTNVRHNICIHVYLRTFQFTLWEKLTQDISCFPLEIRAYSVHI